MKLFKSDKPIALWLTSFILLLCLIVTSSFAWFTANSVVQITSPSEDNLAVQVNSGDLEIAVAYQQTSSAVYGRLTEYSAYGTELDLKAETPTFIDVSGNGEVLYFPRSLTTDNLPVDVNTNWETVTDAMGYCLTLKVKFRTSQKMTVFLDNTSFVRGVEDITDGSYVRSSSFGDFSCDGICAAVRVAFLEIVPSSAENPDGLDLKTVWVPNDKYELKYVTSGSTEIASYLTDGSRESAYYYWYDDDGLIKKGSYGDTSLLNGELTVGTYGLANPTYSLANTATPLLEFEANGEMQEKEMLIRIWFEGTDREADIALDGGAIYYNFGFTGINKDPESEENKNFVNSTGISGDALCYNDGNGNIRNIVANDGILYSTDAIEWNKYSGADLSAYNFIYIRKEESQACFAGHAIKLTKD